MSISITHQGPISTVTLNLPPMNLLTIETMDALLAAHQEVDARPETRVIVTASDAPNMFSNGLDPAYVLKLDNPGRVDVFRAVGRLLYGLLALTKPHIAAINGPAMAGGAIIAITADFRIFEAEHGRMSFSEPKIGLPIPRAVSQAIKLFANGGKHVHDIVMLAKNMDAQDALAAGLANEVVPADALVETVGKLAGRLSRLSPAVLAATKNGLRQEVLEIAKPFAEGEAVMDHFVGDKFLGEGLTALVEQRFPNYVE